MLKLLYSLLLATTLLQLPAQAFVTYYDFRGMVQHATLIVRGTVVELETVKVKQFGNETELKVARLKVASVIAGACAAETIQAVYGDSVQYDESGFTVGEECLLCLIPSYQDPALYYEINFGSGKMVIQRGQTDLGKIKIPENMKELLKNKDVENIQNVIQWCRGPKLEIKAVKESFEYDKALKFKFTLTNPTAIPMPLLVDSNHGSEVHFWSVQWDGAGFQAAQQTWAGAPEKRNPENDSSEMPTDDVEIKAKNIKMLEPGKSYSGEIRFHPRKEYFSQSPERIRKVSIFYVPIADDTGKGWSGWVGAQCPLSLTCRDAEFGANLQQPNSSWALELSTQGSEKPSPQQVKILFKLSRPPSHYDPETSGGMNNLPLAEYEKLVARLLQITRDGKVISEPTADPKEIEKLLSAMPPKEDCFGLELELAKHLKVEKGEYSIRCVLPDAKTPSLSNVLKIKVE